MSRLLRSSDGCRRLRRRVTAMRTSHMIVTWPSQWDRRHTSSPCLHKFIPLAVYMCNLLLSHIESVITRILIKTYSHDKRVCGTETSSSMPYLISFSCAVSLNADWAGPMGKRTIWKFERLPQTCLGPQAVFVCQLNPLYSHSAKTMSGNELGESSLIC